MTKKLFIIIFILFNFFTNISAIEPEIFVQSTVNRASKLLGEDITKENKIEQLKLIAKDTVDIRGIGYYTLGSARKLLNEDQKKKYSELFEDIINNNYTIVNSTLKATNERPEIKIDWRIYTKNPENPLIRDLIIEGLSLARTQKEEFSSVLNSNDGDIESLFKILREFSNK